VGARAFRTAVAVALVAASCRGRAFAAEPILRTTEVPLPRVPAPFVLPALTHRRLDLRLDWLVGRMAPLDETRPGSAVALVRASGEARITRRHHVYVGFLLPFGAALPPDGAVPPGAEATVRASGLRGAVGNVESWIRAVFALPAWLEIGFGLGVVAPTAQFDRNFPPNRSATEAVASLEPTDSVHFLPGRVALRPAVDIRILRGPFILQAREGLDIMIDDKGIERARTAGRLLAHLGVLARPDLEVSLEATQISYFFSDDKPAEATGTALSPSAAFDEKYRVSDERRTAYTIGPGVRFYHSHFDFGVSTLTNLFHPLSPAVDSFLALRFSVIARIP
jgi:hypothetical protein